MTTWNFKREEVQFEQIAVGDHRAIITDVQRKTSRSGKDMLELTFAVSGYKATIRSWIVFLEDRTGNHKPDFNQSYGFVQYRRKR